MATTLSIITVNLNNNNGLIKTLESIKKQSFDSYEHIIIDGGSIDGSLSTIQEYSKQSTKLSYWISEKDEGIYHAMNKGIDVAKGEYLIFLNSGDKFHDNILHMIPFDGTKYIYGDVNIIFSKNHSIETKSPFPIDPVFLLLEDTICHQVCFIHHTLFNNQRYSTKYTLASDWIHIVKNIILENCTYQHIPICITDYDGNGISATSGSLGVNERNKWIKNNFPNDLYNSLIELAQARKKLKKIQKSGLEDIILLISSTRKFKKRIRNIIILLYNINRLFSKKRRRYNT